MQTDIGKKVKILRISHDLYQSELAERVGVTQTHISDIENGKKTPSLDLIIKISNSLGCSVDYLVKKLIINISVKERVLLCIKTKKWQLLLQVYVH